MLKKRFFISLLVVIFIFGILVAVGLFDKPILDFIAGLIHRRSPEHTRARLHGSGLVICATSIILAVLVLYVRAWVMNALVALQQALRPASKPVNLWIEKNLKSEEDVIHHGKIINQVDGVIILSFLIYSALVFIGRLQRNYPYVNLSSDAANIASFAAAWDHPEAFKGDELLSDLNNIRIYSTIHIPLIRWLSRVTGNYSLGMMVMLGPHIFIFLLGLYTFGRVLIKNRFWALLFTMVSATPFSINLGEGWGIFMEPLPRFTFQDLLFFLLALAWVWRYQPRRWPWIMAAAGALVYIHPVSAPAWILALWLGIWYFMPAQWTITRRLLVMLGLGLIAVLIAVPFVLNYLGHHVQGESPNINLVYYVIDTFFPENILNIPTTMAEFMSMPMLAPLFPLSLIGFMILWIVSTGVRKDIQLILAWLAALLLIAVIVPWIEHIIEKYLSIVPVETELVRSIRYFIPFMFLFIFMPLAEFHSRLKNRMMRIGILATGLLFVMVWIVMVPRPQTWLKDEIDCFTQGKLICSAPNDLGQTMDAIRRLVPSKSTVFYSGAAKPTDAYGLIIRYQALRGLAFSKKDNGLLVYSNDAVLKRWNTVWGNLMDLDYLDRTKKLTLCLRLSKELSAQYMLLDFKPDPRDLAIYKLEPVYNNKSYGLYDVSNIQIDLASGSNR